MYELQLDSNIREEEKKHYIPHDSVFIRHKITMFQSYTYKIQIISIIIFTKTRFFYHQVISTNLSQDRNFNGDKHCVLIISLNATHTKLSNLKKI